MAAGKLTPLQALERKKVYIRLYSDALVDSLEDNFQYLQENFGSLVGHATVDAAIAKLPPVVQNLLGHGRKDDRKCCRGNQRDSGAARYADYADKALDIVPFFAKGAKGMVLTFLLKRVKNMLFKR
jgi:hypothetical protein